MNPEAQVLRQKVRERVRTAVFAPSSEPALPAFTRYFQERFGSELLAVILYGSCLSQVTRRESSIYDFFLICDRYRPFYRDLKLALFNYCLPPNIFYLELQDPEAGRLAGKYSVTSLRDFRHETSPRARDTYHLGRFAKRVIISYTRDEKVREGLLDAILSAMEQNIALALTCLPDRFPRDEFILTLLGMSYRGETRMDLDTKVEELFRAEAEYYRQCYTELLRAYLLENNLGSESNGGYSLPEKPLRRRFQLMKARAFLFQTRIRTYLRWPKYIITFDNWLDYLLSKLERSKGIRLELTARERKYPLIFCWKHFFRLKRAGKIK
ncbi:MAG: hypothetical protein NT056_02765 [Proteobacteria bacterium]|nr:hypothetical protein [Pseudomonadota bacterium]